MDASQLDADEPTDELVVLSPSLGRRWWILVASMAAIYTGAMVAVGLRHHRWQFLPLVAVVFAVAALPLWWMRRRMRVTLAHGVLTRPMGRVRIPASEVIDVTTGLGPMGRRSVYVTTRAGNLVPVGLEGPDPHHAVQAMGTIRRWARAHGAAVGGVAPKPLPPFSDGTVLPVARVQTSVAAAVVAGSWVALLVRSFQLRPPWWVLACGAVGTLLAAYLLVVAWRMQVRIDGDTLAVPQRARTLRITARDIAGFDLTPDQYVRVLRTSGAPVPLRIKGGAVPGLVGRLTAWAQAHGGGTGAAVTSAPRVGWAWRLGSVVGVMLVCTPLFWGMWPHDVGRGYFMGVVSMGSGIFFSWLQAQEARR